MRFLQFGIPRKLTGERGPRYSSASQRGGAVGRLHGMLREYRAMATRGQDGDGEQPGANAPRELRSVKQEAPQRLSHNQASVQVHGLWIWACYWHIPPPPPCVQVPKATNVEAIMLALNAAIAMPTVEEMQRRVSIAVPDSTRVVRAPKSDPP